MLGRSEYDLWYWRYQGEKPNCLEYPLLVCLGVLSPICVKLLLLLVVGFTETCSCVVRIRDEVGGGGLQRKG